MAEKELIKVKMDITPEIRALFKRLNEMDKESKNELKDKVKPIALWVAGEIKTAASYAPMYKQALAVSESVRVSRDRVPSITIGGSKKAKVTRKKTERNPAPTVGELLYGSEFGADPTSEAGAFPNGGRRFPYRSPKRGQGNEGYWIYPTLRLAQPRITREWHAEVDKVLDKWDKGVMK
jgi:hypothetical protein